jgi:DNA-binding beta-propeller fold protein YncE
MRKQCARIRVPQVSIVTAAGSIVTAAGSGLLAISIAFTGNFSARAVERAPLTIEAKIPLGDVRGRIDHLAIDHARQRLFVAELGNNSLSIVDLKEQKVLHRIAGLNEPQGVAYVSGVDSIFVSNGGDGSVRIFSGDDFSPLGRVDLKADADNLRVDLGNNLVFVGFGLGGLAIIDARARAKLGEIGLKGHPEGFELEPTGKRIFVNIPDNREIAVIDRSSNTQVASWKTSEATANFPIAVRQKSPELLTVFRKPPRLAAVDTRSGNVTTTVSTCGDADDVFVDDKRDRAYVSCGEGFIDVFQLGRLSRTNHIPTAVGARTALYDPDMDRFFLAVKANHGIAAAIWTYKPEGN